jgi:hypothetical protein
MRAKREETASERTVADVKPSMTSKTPRHVSRQVTSDFASAEIAEVTRELRLCSSAILTCAQHHTAAQPLEIALRRCRHRRSIAQPECTRRAQLTALNV